MRVTAGVLTWNPLSNHRKKLLRQTVESLAGCDSVAVFDNGSSDVYDLDAEVIKLPPVRGFPHGNTCGYGMNKMARALDGDVIILSNDDILWNSGAIDTLREVWGEASDELTILSGLVEPTFSLPDTEPWNQPKGVVEVAGRRVLLRKSVPGGAWSYRSVHRDRIFPVSTFNGTDDVPACHRLNVQGFQTGCLALAEHAGVGQSTWGNASHERFQVTPVEAVREEYGL